MAATLSTTLTVAVICRTSAVRSARSPTRTEGPRERSSAAATTAESGPVWT